MQKLMFLNSKVGGSPFSLLGGFTHFGSQVFVHRVIWRHKKLSVNEFCVFYQGGGGQFHLHV